MQADSPVVYLVDDDDAVRDSLSLLLRSVGMNVKAFAHPSEFFEQFRGDELGCLVLDIRMPAISGLAVQERLVATGCRLPIIMITGHGDVAQCRRAFLSGAVDFLTKPIDEQVLIDSLQKAVRVCRDGQAARHQIDEAKARFNKLTPREREVCERVADGLINKRIAEDLGLSLRTVEAYRASGFEKLEVASVAELVRMKLLAD
ncbi:response regulator transcription factor [Cupriavidus oxalaticus]|nr:response regulator [Cupriavidus oxalaticus]QRQ89112.1 response regulator transcription factor [Cupriavidus oxalaticus]QRQ96108.1 response regulator transcription factor [Cupriavidus oxalaticus]WQD84730.1 response regulator [Cupriavidus oxalaticus]